MYFSIFTGLIVSFFIGIQSHAHMPSLYLTSTKISPYIALTFILIFWYLDYRYEIISDNKSRQVAETYIKLGSYTKTANKLNMHTEEVRREIMKFIEKTLR